MLAFCAQFMIFLFATVLAQAVPAATPVPDLTPSPANDPLLKLFQDGTFYLSAIIEAGAGIVIGIAAAQAIFQSFVLFIRNGNQAAKEDVRLNLGRWLAVALEFELAADILRTAVAPSWSEIGQLAAIAALRTALNYFLQQEIDKAARRGSVAQAPMPSTAPAPSHAPPQPGTAPQAGTGGTRLPAAPQRNP